jgi:hypothetical protein
MHAAQATSKSTRWFHHVLTPVCSKQQINSLTDFDQYRKYSKIRRAIQEN